MVRMKLVFRKVHIKLTRIYFMIKYKYVEHIHKYSPSNQFKITRSLDKYQFTLRCAHTIPLYENSLKRIH